MNKKQLGSRIAAALSGAVLLWLGLMHMSAAVRFSVQSALIDLDDRIAATLDGLLGTPYFVHDGRDPADLAASMSRKSPTRYFRDVLFWVTFKPGDSFFVEGMTRSRDGVLYVSFRGDRNLYRGIVSIPKHETVCLGSLEAVILPSEQQAPVYALTSGDYVVTLISDGSEKWKQLTRPCPQGA